MQLITAIMLSIAVPPIEPVRMFLISQRMVHKSKTQRSCSPCKRNIATVATSVAVGGMTFHAALTTQKPSSTVREQDRDEAPASAC